MLDYFQMLLLLFEFYNIPNNLVLERVELFYQSKMIGSIDINEKINNLENCGDDYFDELGRKVGNKGYLLEKVSLELWEKSMKSII